MVLIFLALACCTACLGYAWYCSAGGLTGRLRRERGWAALLLLLVAGAPGLLNPNWWSLVSALGLSILGVACVPELPRRMVPLLLLGVGLLAFVLAIAYPGSDHVLFGTALLGAGNWPTYLAMPLAYAFIVAGVWLLWRSRAWRSRLARLLLGTPDATAGHRVWALLLLPVTGLLIELIGFRWWTSTNWAGLPFAGLLVVAAVMLMRRAPLAAADLTAAGALILGGYGIALGFLWSAHIFTPSSFTPNLFYGAALVHDRPSAVLASVEGAAIFGLGAWLAPRTIGRHARALIAGEPYTALASRVEQLTKTRTVAVDSAAAELRRIERDLHDGAQARLVALGMNLRAVERLIQHSPQAALALVTEARESSSQALADLRDLIRGIYPPVLADRGLGDAVRALALDLPIRTEVDIDLAGRPEAPVESACYFAVAEALTNAVRHSGGRCVQVRMRHTGRGTSGLLRIEVSDDGAGGADPASGSGLAGVEKRLATFDGIVAISSPPGGPTMIAMEVPCALSSPRTSSC
jgi:signal transduction histidine kinase